MRQNNVDFQNRQLPTNILALLLVNEQQQREKASGRSRPNWRSRSRASGALRPPLAR
jgi:hypothetical protein